MAPERMHRAFQRRASHGRTPHRRAAAALAVALAALLVSGCGGGDTDLNNFVRQVKASPGGRVEALPEVQPYAAYSYADQSLRSPFVPSVGGAGSVRPDNNRQREYLEQYPLDTLKMVGTLMLGGVHYGLVLAHDGRVHRVTVGNHVGQNDGTITDISASKIGLTEIVADGLGGYLERPAALALNQ